LTGAPWEAQLPDDWNERLSNLFPSLTNFDLRIRAIALHRISLIGGILSRHRTRKGDTPAEYQLDLCIKTILCVLSNDPEPVVRKIALGVLVRMEAAKVLSDFVSQINEVDRLTEILEASKTYGDTGANVIRRSAATALGRCDPHRALPMLLDLLENYGYSAGCEAAEALGQLRDERAIEPLSRSLTQCRQWKSLIYRENFEAAVRRAIQRIQQAAHSPAS